MGQSKIAGCVDKVLYEVVVTWLWLRILGLVVKDELEKTVGWIRFFIAVTPQK